MTSLEQVLFGRLAALTVAAGVALAGTTAFALSDKPAPLPQRETITVAVQERAGFMAPLQNVGPILESMNIAIKQVAFQRYPDSRSAILSHAVDVGATGAPHVIQNLANGGDTLVALRGVAGLKMYPVVRNGIKVEKWSDLKGKRVGVGVGGNVWTAFVAKLKEEGIAYTEIKDIGIQGSGQNFNVALQRGDIDVSICWSPFVEQAVVQNIGYAPAGLEFGYTQALGPEQGMWVTTKQNLAAKRELLKRFLWAYAKSEEMINGSQQVKLDTLTQFTGLEPAVAAKTTEWIQHGNAITHAQMEAMAKMMFDLGIVNKDVSGQIKPHYDLSLATEVGK